MTPARERVEVLLADEVMHTTPIIAHARESPAELSTRADVRRQWLYPVMEEPAGLLEVIPRPQLIELGGHERVPQLRRLPVPRPPRRVRL